MTTRSPTQRDRYMVAVGLFRLVEEPLNRGTQRLAAWLTARQQPGVAPMLVEG